MEEFGIWFDKFWDTPIPVIAIIILIVGVIYYAYVKKSKVAEAVVKTVVQEYLNIAQTKGVTVEIFVDNLIARAVKKVKETPDKTDTLVLAFLQSSLTRNKLIEIIKKQVAAVAGDEAILNAGSREEAQKEEAESPKE